MSQQASGRQPFSRNAMVLAPLKRQELPGFPPELDTKVNLSKVNLEVLQPWIATRITELMGGVEDEVLIGMVCNILSEGPHPSGRDMYAGLLSFLAQHTADFLRELWGHLRSAEANALPGVPGIAQFLLDAKREELQKRDAAAARMQSSLAGSRFGDGGSALPPPPPLSLPPPPPLPKPPSLPVGGDDRPRAPRWDDRKRERSRSGERRSRRYSRSHSRDRRRDRRRGSESDDDSRERKRKRKHKHRRHRSRSRSASKSRSRERRRGAEGPDAPPPLPSRHEAPDAAALPRDPAVELHLHHHQHEHQHTLQHLQEPKQEDGEEP